MALKSILFGIQSSEERKRLIRSFTYEDYRVFSAENILSLLETLHNYRIDMLISEADFPGIPMTDLLSYLRRKYFDLKVILTTREYSPEIELKLRPFKILYIMAWPVNEQLLQSIVARGLEAERTDFACVSSC
jgi:DNA-binding NtrC family response regulator